MRTAHFWFIGEKYCACCKENKAVAPDWEFEEWVAERGYRKARLDETNS